MSKTAGRVRILGAEGGGGSGEAQQLGNEDDDFSIGRTGTQPRKD